MAISLRPESGRAASSLSRLLSTFGLGEPPSATTRAACDRIGDCSREDCPFHPARRSGRHRFCCSRVVPHAPAPMRKRRRLGTVSISRRCCPGFRRAPCSVLLGLSSGARAPAAILPDTPCCLVNAPHHVMRGRPSGIGRMVPKEGFEPSRPYGHYALNVARLPIPPLRRCGADDRI